MSQELCGLKALKLIGWMSSGVAPHVGLEVFW
jgi:hypothetical protein